MPPEEASAKQVGQGEDARLDRRTTAEAGSRRLNRREFGSALQDLTGLTVDFAYSIPGDGKVNGFDTGAEALQDAADSVNQIMEVTRRAVDGIRFLEPAPVRKLRADLVNVEKDPHKLFDPWKDSGVTPEKTPRIARPGLGALIEPKWPRDRSSSMFGVTAPEDGRVSPDKIQRHFLLRFPDVPNPIAWVKIGGRVIDRQEISGPVDLEYQVQYEDSILGKGLSISFTPRVEMPYAVKGFENEDKSKPSELPARTVSSVRCGTRGCVIGRSNQDPSLPSGKSSWNPITSLFVRLNGGSISVSFATTRKAPGNCSPFGWAGLPPAGQNKWRKPFFAFYQKLRGNGMTFDALRSTFQSVLMSSPFRYLASNAHEDKVIADHAVASRLSFMLSGAPPDAQLLGLAGSGKLRDLKVLEAEADRLLADPRSHRFFIRPFVTQWLEMEQPITLVDDHRGKASYHFRRHLQDSMREETHSYFGRLIADDRPAVS